eukprot:1793274-Amphidinium_carterae.1
MGLCGTWRGDEHHRLWNNVRRVVQESGFGLALVAAQMVFNITSGPFGQRGNLRQVEGAAEQYFKEASPT